MAIDLVCTSRTDHIPRDFTFVYTTLVSFCDPKIHLHSDIDAKQTYRIREIKGSPQRAFYGREYHYRITLWAYVFVQVWR